MSVEVTANDELTAQAIIAVEFDNSHANFAAEVAELVATHRHQAEEAMRERCAKVADQQAIKSGCGLLRAQQIAAAIRGMEVE